MSAAANPASWMLAGSDRGLLSLAEQETEAVGHPLAQRGEWWACRHPERPIDRLTVMHDRCTPCMLAATAGVAAGTVGQYVVDTMRARITEHGEAER